MQVTGGGPKCLVLYDDPAGETRATLTRIFEEIMPLFDDEVFHVGGDETQQGSNPSHCQSVINYKSIRRDI